MRQENILRIEEEAIEHAEMEMGVQVQCMQKLHSDAGDTQRRRRERDVRKPRRAGRSG
jgi:hypothetical protein